MFFSSWPSCSGIPFGKKYSLAGAHIYAAHAFVDPELTYDLPLEPTIHTGLDAINQAAESIWNNNASPITMSYAFQALKFGITALQELNKDLNNLDARTAMSECSLLSGLAISHTRTALCHSISYPLTAHFGVPHGLACAYTMTEVLKLNMRHDDGRFTFLSRYLETNDLMKVFKNLAHSLNINERVNSYIPKDALLHDLVEEMYTPGRANNNLAPVSTEVINRVLANLAKHDT